MAPAYSQAPQVSETIKNLFIIIFAFFSTLIFFICFLEPIGAMVARPVQGPCGLLALLATAVLRGSGGDRADPEPDPDDSLDQGSCDETGK